MMIGIPKEIKVGEKRVALTPKEVGRLVHAGHHLLVERGAGVGSGVTDDAFQKAGALMVTTKRQLYAQATLIVKVKEPEGDDLTLLSSRHLLCCFLHLAAHPKLLTALLRKKVTAIGFETIEEDDGSLPCLVPMSEIAGKVAAQVGAITLGSDRGGAGILLGGAPGVDPGIVVVIGIGTVGRHAAVIVRGLGARVLLYDRDETKARQVAHEIGGEAISFSQQALAGAVASADLVIGAVLVPGRRAPQIVTRSMIAKMRLGSVVIDVAIDQGGCMATSHPTTLARPTFIIDGVVHYCVPNLPSLVARTATLALARSIFPKVRALADLGLKQSASSDPALARAINVMDGKIVHPALLR